jgi:ubiquinone biosynthesis protein COQ9
MDKEKAAAAIIEKALPLVPFDGWNQQTLAQAAVAAGYKKTDVIRVFPGGAIDAIDFFLNQSDTQMLDIIAGYHLDSMKIRERISSAIQAKLNTLAPHREALRRAIAMHAMPFYCHRGLRAMYKTVDHIWYAIGDTSSDFNFYTKRITLGGVYSTTLLFWLDDKSAGFENTWAFLDRRIADIMTIEKAKHQFRNWRQQHSI